MYFNGGNIYEGEFKEDKFEGKGIIYYINGDRKLVIITMIIQ